MPQKTVVFAYSPGDQVIVPTKGRATVLELRYDDDEGQAFLCDLADGSDELLCTGGALKPWTEDKAAQENESCQ